MTVRVSRRTALKGAAALGLAAGPLAGAAVSMSAQSTPTGRILFARPNGLWVWENGDATQLLKDETVSDPAWSPDGTRMAVIRAGNSYSDLFVFDPAANTLLQVTYNQAPYQEGTLDYTTSSAWAVDVDWSASGVMGFMSDYASPDGTFQLWLVNDPSAGAYLAPAAQFEDNIDSLSLSADGSIAAYARQERLEDGTSVTRAILRDLNDGIAYPLADDLNAFDPSISPDLDTVAVAVRAGDGSTDIYVIDRATGDQTRITNGMQATNPEWSPDAAWLGFVRMVDFEFEVWAVAMTGSIPGEPVKLFKARDFDAPSGFSWTY